MELERQENVLVVGHQVRAIPAPSISVQTRCFFFVTGHPSVSVRSIRFCVVNRRPDLVTSYAYFHNLPQADLPYIKIPLHTVIKLTPKAYGCDEERCVPTRIARHLLIVILGIHFPLGL